jgi:hypothetical protein
MLSTATDERASILRMIEEHKITADEGAQLLSALGKPAEQKIGTRPFIGGGPNRFFKVLVSDMTSGRTKTSVTIPLGLVRWGLKVGARFNGEIDGVDMDELANLIASGAQGQIIEVMDEEEGEHVQIFVE